MPDAAMVGLNTGYLHLARSIDTEDLLLQEVFKIRDQIDPQSRATRVAKASSRRGGRS